VGAIRTTSNVALRETSFGKSMHDMKKRRNGHMGNLKETPNFKGSEEEAIFWDSHDSAEYIDWSQAKKTVFPNLKSSTESISLRSSS
jgi:CopG antitoxin of type II toxin-antitoxin system